MVMKLISSKEAKKKLDEKTGIIIDVRSPAEFESEHINGAYNIPIDRIKEFEEDIFKTKKDIMLICRSGARANNACVLIQDHLNNRDVYVIEGGIVAWEHNKFDVIYGKNHWALDRQVRLLAGFLVTLGVVLGFFVSNYFLLLSLFIGLGLMFAAISNTCGMAYMLSKLPYNQVKYNSIEKVVQKMIMEN